METPQKRQKSWLSSLTGLVSGSRASTRDAPSSSATPSRSAASSVVNGERATSRLRLTRSDEQQTPARHSGTFSAPPFESPESPVKRASPTQLAQRKIHDRVQGPSGRVAGAGTASSAAGNVAYRSSLYGTGSLSRSSMTPRRTNFSSATTPRNMFRDSISRDMPTFTFTPRVPANTMRGSFPATTPGRSLRAPGAELGAREMAKVAPSELFHMKIPDPDPTLSGEAVTNMMPDDLKHRPGSLYANQYLAHLCPPEFDEEQRNQFFCILDLRRLKYAADDVFTKKDWRLNIMNFAKEYEKNRSLIMLRYGLYEFKTVKVSRDVFEKWKTEHNIPDDDTDDKESTSKALTKHNSSVPRVNGTEGLLRSTKRKAQDQLDPLSVAVSASQASIKRSRALDGASKAIADRPPLAETSTPALNKAKRKATRPEGADQLQRAKIQKPAPTAASPAAPSATKAFFEKVANSPAKETPTSQSAVTTSTPSIHVSKPSSDSSGNAAASTPAPAPASLFKPSAKPSTNGSLARSVLEGGLKAGAAQNNNIFGYLSDASSAKGSGNDNADADAEDTDDSDGQEEEESEGHDAATVSRSASANGTASTPQPASSLFFPPKPAVAQASSTAATNGSAASSDLSDATPGRSLFDRVNKGTDGQPIRMFGDGSSATPPASTMPSLFVSKPQTSDKAAAPEKEATASSLFGANKTWTPDSPIKFAASGASSSATGQSLFGKPSSSTSAAAAPAAEKPSTEKSTTATSLFGAPKESTTAAPAATPSTAATPLFGFLNKPADAATTATTTSTTTPAPAASTATSLFGAANHQSSSSAASLFGKTPAPVMTTSSSAASLFGKAPAPASTATPAATTPASTAAPVLGSSATTPALQSQTLFGTSKSEAPSFGLKRSADDESPGSASALFGKPAKSNGTSGGDEPQAKRALFGGASGATTSSGTSAPLFSFGAPKTNGTAAEKPADSTGAKPQEAKSLFGNTAVGATTEPAKAPAGGLFGNATPTTSAPAVAAPALFSFGGGNTSTTTSQPSGSLFSFGGSSSTQPTTAAGPSISFGGGGGNETGSAGSSFTFSMGGGAAATQSFRNPFASGDASSASAAPATFNFGGGASSTPSSAPSTSLFQFGSSAPTPTPATTAGATGGSLFSFGGGSQSTEAATTPGNSFSSAPATNGVGSSSTMFSFGAGGASQPTSTPLFGQQPASGGSMFNLAPPMAGASSGTNTPFTNLGGASSLATTPATGTPEPGANQDNADNSGHQADGDEAPQEQISLTEGGPGEEDEAVVHEVRAKAMRLVIKDESESESPAPKEKKSPWRTEGVGPLRLLKNKTTGAVRLLLRAEPRGAVALNRALLPDFTYKPEPNAKYLKLTTANASGNGLETWMIQVKTKELAQTLADVLEENKTSGKK